MRRPSRSTSPATSPDPPPPARPRTASRSTTPGGRRGEPGSPGARRGRRGVRRSPAAASRSETRDAGILAAESSEERHGTPNRLRQLRLRQSGGGARNGPAGLRAGAGASRNPGVRGGARRSVLRRRLRRSSGARRSVPGGAEAQAHPVAERWLRPRRPRRGPPGGGSRSPTTAAPMRSRSPSTR